MLPIFTKEALKHNIFDKIYIITNFRSELNLDPRCQVILLQEDMQFSSNILYGLNYVKEDIFLLCCEDHVMVDPHDPIKFDKCFDFVENNGDVGMLRLTHNKKIKFDAVVNTDVVQIKKLHKKYAYYISLQPSIWRKPYLMHCLKYSENAWEAEVNGTRRAIKHPQFGSFCVTENVFLATNFFKSGKHIRHYFVDYAVANNIKIPTKFSVFDKRDGVKRIVTVQQYLNPIPESAQDLPITESAGDNDISII